MPNSTARRGARATKPRHKQPHHRDADRGHSRGDRDDSRGDRDSSRYDRQGGTRYGRQGGTDRTDSRHDRRAEGGYRGHTNDTPRRGYRGHTDEAPRRGYGGRTDEAPRRGYRDESSTRHRKSDPRRSARRDTNDWFPSEQRHHTDRNRRDYRDERPGAQGRRDERPADERRTDRPQRGGQWANRTADQNHRPDRGRNDYRDRTATHPNRAADRRPTDRANTDRHRDDRRPAADRYAATAQGRHSDTDFRDDFRDRSARPYRATDRPGREAESDRRDYRERTTNRANHEHATNRPHRAADQRPTSDRRTSDGATDDGVTSDSATGDRVAADRRPSDRYTSERASDRRTGDGATGGRADTYRRTSERADTYRRDNDRSTSERAADRRPTEARRNGEATSHWDGEITEDGRRQSSVTFAELGLPTPLLRALEETGITEPFPIQAATLPDALGGRDVLGRAQTGSGKTLAFGLALLTRLHKGKSRPGQPRGLVLVPTRELAMQVADALLPLAKSLGLWCRTVVGGMSFGKQAEQLQRGIDLLIATPGRLSDHVRQGTCVLDDVRFVALDEADQMADMGFLPQVRAILDLVPTGQRMLFSATLDRDVAALVDSYLTDPVTHSVSPATATVSTMDHHLLLVSHEDKPAVVAEMAARDGRTIMFLRTKHHVDRLTSQLREVGVRAGALHGGKPQGARNRVLGEFKDGRVPVLIATDVAARGIHVDGVSLVVHVDPPADAKGYLHRAGRTARAGEAGTVVTLVTHQERRTVFRMTEQAGVAPERTKVRPGDDDLARITGARTPSGEPLADEPIRRPGRLSRKAPRRGR